MDRHSVGSSSLCLMAVLVGALLGCSAEDMTSDRANVVQDVAELRSGRACASSADCRQGYCTTEDGVCNPAPGCKRGTPCPAVCYGTCEKCDYSDPNRSYVSMSPAECSVIRFICAEGYEAFFNACGCGCVQVQ